jgi:hypothetical protein
MSQPKLCVSSGKYAIFPDRKTVIFLSVADINGLPVSLTSYANFVVLFSVTVVNEMQVLLTTHESTNFSNLFFLLIHKTPCARPLTHKKKPPARTAIRLSQII